MVGEEEVEEVAEAEEEEEEEEQEEKQEEKPVTKCFPVIKKIKAAKPSYQKSLYTDLVQCEVCKISLPSDQMEQSGTQKQCVDEKKCVSRHIVTTKRSRKATAAGFVSF